jgi:hypothetical protein
VTQIYPFEQVATVFTTRRTNESHERKEKAMSADRPNSISVSTKEFPPFRLDRVNECLWRHHDDGDEERIRLTPKAFAVCNIW